jgi:hypothetical protein
MKPTSRSIPGSSVASIDLGTMAAVTSPVARVAKAPIERRAASIGTVNVIAAATLAYAGHESRRMVPATITMVTQTNSPATTPRIFFDIFFVPLNDRRQDEP